MGKSTPDDECWARFKHAALAVKRFFEGELDSPPVPWPLPDSDTLAASRRIFEVVARILGDAPRDAPFWSHLQQEVEGAACLEFELLGLARRDRRTKGEALMSYAWTFPLSPSLPSDELINLTARKVAAEVMAEIRPHEAISAEKLALFNRIAEIVVEAMGRYHCFRPVPRRGWWPFRVRKP